MMNDVKDNRVDIKITEKVEADGCCCGQNWFHFFWTKKTESSNESHTTTPTTKNPDYHDSLASSRGNG